MDLMLTHAYTIAAICLSSVLTQYPTVSDKFDIRLVDGPSKSEGRLEVFLLNEWGTACRYRFEYVQADLVCRQLGFDIASEVMSSSESYGKGNGSVLVIGFYCNGTETYLWQCLRRYNKGENCDDGSGVVAVGCASLKDGQIYTRFAYSKARIYGNIQLFYNRTLGYICPRGDWGMNEANVTCKQLGFKRAILSKLPKGIDRYNNRVYPSNYLAKRIVCDGTEERLDECKINDYDIIDDCGNYIAGVTCSKEGQFDVRLADDPPKSVGRLEVFIQNEWRWVCRSDFGQFEANLACSQLGLDVALGVTTRYSRRDRGQTFIRFHCTGSETYLWQCYYDFVYWFCNDMTIRCTPEKDPFDVRLADSLSKSEGRLEVYIENEWTWVCRSNFGLFEANLVCSQLDLDFATEVTTRYTRRGQRQIRFRCTGSETFLWQCNFDFDNRYCDDMTIRCAPDKDEFNVRLVDGPSKSEGRLEFFLQNTWGTACINAFDNVEADLVCRYLGFDIASEVESSKSYGQGNGPILVTSLNCEGSEDIRQCRRGGQGHNCSESGVVAIRCASVKDGELFIRLSTRIKYNFGNIDVYYNGTLSNICPRGDWGKWGMNEANVACKQLGFKRATHSKLPERYMQDDRVNLYSSCRNFGKIIICDGTEERLEECDINHDYGINDCTCFHYGNAASVTCTHEALLPSGKVTGIAMAALLYITMVIVVSVIIYAIKKRKHIPPGK